MATTYSNTSVSETAPLKRDEGGERQVAASGETEDHSWLELFDGPLSLTRALDASWETVRKFPFQQLKFWVIYVVPELLVAYFVFDQAAEENFSSNLLWMMFAGLWTGAVIWHGFGRVNWMRQNLKRYGLAIENRKSLLQEIISSIWAAIPVRLVLGLVMAITAAVYGEGSAAGTIFFSIVIGVLAFIWWGEFFLFPVLSASKGYTFLVTYRRRRELLSNRRMMLWGLLAAMGFLWVSLWLNLLLLTQELPMMVRMMMGIEIMEVAAGLSLENNRLIWVLILLTGALLEPLMRGLQIVFYLDILIRREGLDLKAAMSEWRRGDEAQ